MSGAVYTYAGIRAEEGRRREGSSATDNTDLFVPNL
jgi:hypothetical protein